MLKSRWLILPVLAILVSALGLAAGPLTHSAAALDEIPMVIDEDDLVFNLPFQSTSQHTIKIHGLANLDNIRITKSDLRDDVSGATIDSSNIVIQQSVDIRNGQDTEIPISITATARGNFEGKISFLTNERATSIPVKLDTGPYWEAILPLTIGGYITSLVLWNLIPRASLGNQFTAIKFRIAKIRDELGHFKLIVKTFGPYYYLIDRYTRQQLLHHMKNSEVEEAEVVMKNIEITFGEMIDPENLDVKDSNPMSILTLQRKRSVENLMSGLQTVREEFQQKMNTMSAAVDADGNLMKRISEEQRPDLSFDEVVEEIVKNTSFKLRCYLKAEWQRSLLVNFLTLAAGLIVALGLILQNDYLDSLRAISEQWWRPALILFGTGAGIESAKQLLGNLISRSPSS
jgi:hypothetical protein